MMILCRGQTAALRYRVIWCKYSLVTKNNSDYFFSSWWILQVYFHSFPDGILKNISWILLKDRDIFSTSKHTPPIINLNKHDESESKSVFKHLFVKPSEFRIWASGRTTCSCPSCTWKRTNRRWAQFLWLNSQTKQISLIRMWERTHTNCLLRANDKMYQRTGLFWS